MKGLGLDAEVEIKRRGALYEVSYWWFFGKEQGVQPTMRYYKRDSWIARLFCRGFPWCAGSRDDVRAYVESPFSISAVIWLTATAATTNEKLAEEFLDFVWFESFPMAAFDLMFESIVWDFDCDQLMIYPQRASRLMRDVLELGLMALRERKRMRAEGITLPKFTSKKPVEVSIKGNLVEVRGLGVDIPIFTYVAADGQEMTDVMCKFFECVKSNGAIIASAEGIAMEVLLTWALISMLLKPYEYGDYMRTLAFGVPDSAVRMIGYMLIGTDELLKFKRKTAEVVKRLVDYNMDVYTVRIGGCKRLKEKQLTLF